MCLIRGQNASKTTSPLCRKDMRTLELLDKPFKSLDDTDYDHHAYAEASLPVIADELQTIMKRSCQEKATFIEK